MVGPTVTLWVYLVVCAFITAKESAQQTGSKSGTAAALALSVILTAWVLADARKRGRQLCYGYGAFVFFAWPVVMPVYLFQTRRWKAFVTVLCFGGLWVGCVLLAIAFSFLFNF
jgi:hypothetical protein